jgi:cell division septation protein DedD
MMLSFLTPEQTEENPAPAPPPETPADYEIVLGKRQFAGVLFIAIVFLVVFSAASYIAGEAMSPRRAAPAEPVAEHVNEGPSAPPVAIAPAVQPAPKPAPAPQPPVFADPKKGGLYLQLGAVDKGIAMIMVEGLRTHGFDAFAGPGPSEKIFRVLIGPFADQDAFHRTKDAVDDLSLTAFPRRDQ